MSAPGTGPDPASASLARIPKAFGFAWAGITTAWRLEPAFRQEAIAAIVLLPVAALLPLPAAHRLALACSVLAVMVIELLNSSVESAIDRISLERHELSRCAKDSASAAVLLSIVIAVLVWTMLIGAWLF
jgi:diacylglycerol kinase (ATP)